GLVAGIGALLLTCVGTTGTKEQVNTTGPAAKFTPPPKEIKSPVAAWKVARDFVYTAVARKNPAHSYESSDANMRGGLTLKQWLTGTIPVVFYPTDRLFKINWKNTNYAYPREAMVNLVLIAKPSTGQR